jgi:catechol 2,3-dioxygenase-like lactoylglutathione lyase family enzyme
MNKKFIGYRHTGIITKNIEKSKKFYVELLGMRIIQDFWDDSDYINDITGIKNANVHMIKMKTDDEFVLELLEYTTHITENFKFPVYNVGYVHIALQVKDIENVYEYLKSNGVEFISEPILSSEGIAKVCFCFDPDGTRIELVEMIQ